MDECKLEKKLVFVPKDMTFLNETVKRQNMFPSLVRGLLMIEYNDKNNENEKYRGLFYKLSLLKKAITCF